jgi:hypothetical protein
MTDRLGALGEAIEEAVVMPFCTKTRVPFEQTWPVE